MLECARINGAGDGRHIIMSACRGNANYGGNAALRAMGQRTAERCPAAHPKAPRRRTLRLECPPAVRHGNKRQWFYRSSTNRRKAGSHPPGEPEPGLFASWVVGSDNSMLGWRCRAVLWSEALQACLEFDRRSITQCRVQPSAIVDVLDEGADHLAGVLEIAIVSAVDLLVLESLDEALRLRVVIRITDAAHARLDAVHLQQGGVLAASILHPAVGVMNQAARRRPPRSDRHLQRRGGEVCPQDAGPKPSQ